MGTKTEIPCLTSIGGAQRLAGLSWRAIRGNWRSFSSFDSRQEQGEAVFVEILLQICYSLSLRRNQTMDRAAIAFSELSDCV